MTLRPITFNAQCSDGLYSTVAMGFDHSGHTFAVHPHRLLLGVFMVSHVGTGFLLMQVHTKDPEVAIVRAIERLTHIGVLHLDRAVAKANAMDVPRVAAV